MPLHDWMSVLGLITGIIVPLGTLIWAIGDKARISRLVIHSKIDSLHVALDNFRVESANDMGEIRGRVQVIEARSFRTRSGDPDAREM